MNPTRLPIVTLIGSGDPGHPHAELAERVGRLVAKAGCHLLTGGGRGVMADAGRGFTAVAGRRGLAIGVLPAAEGGSGAKADYPNPWVEVPIFTHLAGEDGPESPSSRNPINVLSAWRILALPGRSGTLAEMRLAVNYGKPILALIPEGEAPGDAEYRREIEHLRLRSVVVSPESETGWDEVRRFVRSSEV